MQTVDPSGAVPISIGKGNGRRKSADASVASRICSCYLDTSKWRVIMAEKEYDTSTKIEISRNDLTKEIIDEIHSRLLQRLASRAEAPQTDFSRSSFSKNGFSRSGFSKGVA